MNFSKFTMPYEVDAKYSKRVAYFSMEFALHQPLKVYSGGLGFLAGSHMRSVFELKQNLVGVGILWKFGYYDQSRNQDRTMQVTWMEKFYSFLEDTGLKFQIEVNNHPVWVKAMYLSPSVFNTAPMFFLTTDIPDNDYISRTISQYLYDGNNTTRLAQYILLGKGGAKLLDELNYRPDIYHLNEAHALPAAFHVYNMLGKDKEALKNKLIFTTHTPEEAGNEKHDFNLCHSMSYFDGLSHDEVRDLTGITDNSFNVTLAALRMAKVANGVSALHGEVSRKMWGKYDGICEITSITNAQNWTYWADKNLDNYATTKDNESFDDRKKYMKRRTFEIVADQTGKLFDPNVLTIVWARRFAAYKRSGILTWDMYRFEKLLKNTKYPIQIIWAGKPYPLDYPAISEFNNLVHISRMFPNMAVMTGYELTLSKQLKQCSDIWLNTPRVPREASGTSGMTAAMNGSVNFSTDDGWIPEFAKHGVNSFVVPKVDYENTNTQEQDHHDLIKFYELLENEILPTYYDHPDKWRQIVQQGMADVKTNFDSNRMADEYYVKMFNLK